jgi:hypothetical protein
MKAFDYTGVPNSLLTPGIVAMLTSIHEHKGNQELSGMAGDNPHD